MYVAFGSMTILSQHQFEELALGLEALGSYQRYCGWNSTVEGTSKGVPFLCWPYFADQFLITSYICDVLKVGLRLNAEENGIISRHKIKMKIEELFSHGRIRENALRLKGMAETSGAEK
ncbi:hypothetical protein TIFTF001_054719 [Ficus carica]|uniref:Uncharacterized protein n=1 Tax=Ficus carica TaxID=3494 RepID=A0AA88ECQ6_FICCA|nr:hypothetical protein TIFTF001_054716 [Ficus carica]GMN72369.1 hypothetical protein TIFTF001_054717 [Ficus carica]GMN72372.1 hypothetical protein TIFTF001_054718 [Ficus carica]GMN72376.1 hypothetical protein TIFTF001_054719 [Ficus carica]